MVWADAYSSFSPFIHRPPVRERPEAFRHLERRPDTHCPEHMWVLTGPEENIMRSHRLAHRQLEPSNGCRRRRPGEDALFDVGSADHGIGCNPIVQRVASRMRSRRKSDLSLAYLSRLARLCDSRQSSGFFSRQRLCLSARHCSVCEHTPHLFCRRIAPPQTSHVKGSLSIINQLSCAERVRWRWRRRQRPSLLDFGVIVMKYERFCVLRSPLRILSSTSMHHVPHFIERV